MTDMLTRPTVTPPPGEPSRFDVPAGPPPADHIPGGPPDEHPPADNRGQRRLPRRVAWGAAVLALVAGGGTAGGVLADHYLADDAAPAAATTTATTAGTGTDTTTGSLAAVAAKVSPSIVTILIDSENGSGLGSGVVLTADGLILTNNHVISSGGTVSVRLSDGRTVPARVVAADSTHDLALVQATGLSGLTPATFANGDGVAVGDTVLAFGAPLGLSGTVTSGIVSATDREVDTGGERLTGLIQTDAAINQGNSGGALVDTSGQVIGINVAIATAGDSTGSVGVGFAIPSSTVTSVVQQLQAQAS